MGKILGLDVGIGSLGWAVIDEDNHRIVDLGVRIFESGEEGASKAADRASQVRRSYRANKRLNKRSKQRKARLKQLLETLNVISVESINEYYRTHGNNPDVWRYRSEGLNRRLEPIELASVLINFANYRGYKDFYEDSEDKDAGKLTEAKDRINQIFESKKSSYRTIGQMIYEDNSFRNQANGKLIIRNKSIKNKDGKKETDYKYLIDRNYLVSEMEILLNCQREYGYEQFTPDVIAELSCVIFKQRDFEDGPGPKKGERDDARAAMMINLKGRQTYSGFDELVGNCPFYPDEKRGHRNSQLFDMFVLVNTLSQYTFVSDTGIECACPKAVVEDVWQSLFLNNGTCTVKKLKEICSTHSVSVHIPTELAKKKNVVSASFVKILTSQQLFTDKMVEVFSAEDYMNEDSLSSQIGKVLAQFATPSRRKDEIKAILSEEDFKEIEYAKYLKNIKAAGGANVSFKYMREAIESFFSGEKYGDFQARFNKEHPEEHKYEYLSNTGKLLPIADPDIVRNPVVYRSLNEARKIINAVNSKYKGIKTINVEVAREVGQSFEQRAEMTKYQRKNEEKKEELRKELIAKLSAEKMNVALSDKLLDKYLLWESQKHKCIYSGEDISFVQLVSSTLVQVDHIIPQSIVLDETNNNKVLVLTKENQKKGNRLPLEYMSDSEAKEFANRVNNLHRTGSIGRIKRDYLLLNELTDEEVSGFVDRNINDTRTISKYISNYLKVAYDKRIAVNVIKGSVTSRFRKRWLGSRYKKYNWLPSVYGLEKKTRDLHYYHHAIDAVVVANLTRPYIEIAQDYLKIDSIRREYNKMADKGNAQYASRLYNDLINEKNKSLAKMKDRYGFNASYTEVLLDSGYVPSICDDLRNEIEARIPLNIKMDMRSYQDMLSAYKELKVLLSEVQINFKENDAVAVDPEQLERINELIPLVCDKKIVCLKENAQIVMSDKDVEELSVDAIKKNLDSFIKKLTERSVNEYIESIDVVSEEEYSERMLAYYKDDLLFAKSIQLPYVSFKINRRYRGSMTISDNPVALKDTGCKTYKELEEEMNNNLKCSYYVRFNKGIGETGNFTIYDARKYYCIEVFKDDKGKQQIRGIRYVDVYVDKKTGKMILLKPLPVGYEHLIYLFKNEYIRVTKKGKTINNGFGAYRAVENINSNKVKMRVFSNCNMQGRDVCISLINPIIKLEVSILGHIIGEVKCGDQSLFITEKG